jgi:hypothetical protein
MPAGPITHRYLTIMGFPRRCGRLQQAIAVVHRRGSVSASIDKTLKVWELESVSELATFTHI